MYFWWNTLPFAAFILGMMIYTFVFDYKFKKMMKED